MRARASSKLAVFAAASLLLAAVALLSLTLGAIALPPVDVARALFGQGSAENNMIVLQLRLPRVLAAIMVGAALGTAGALLQGVIRNPLASPDILGVTGGASVFVVGFMTIFAGISIHLIPFIAMAGALCAAALNYALAWRNGIAPARLVMIGIGLSTAAGSLTTFLLISGPAYLANQILNWTTGSLYGVNWSYIGMLWPWLALFLPLSLLLANGLNVQALGDETAIGLGSRLQGNRLASLAVCTALVGAAVGVAGMLSFIGLMTPHMARKLAGLSYHCVLPLSALLGGIILLLADLAGRMLFAPLDIPAGVFTAGVGAPFFLYLLYKTRRSSPLSR
ncbi:iron ABC transporter permease [Paenibacillus sp. YN15]|uniref:FecCD family ABC transporter permease n=1 Tax=Paenibacillus sp. YN15 TaxID=1742774 RepID=UPI000DCD66C2|nr:iron ABC transporter permease [Paenibacillus sp. YN15]RAU94211.1 iron ABC transporter permease [Paenibacillus sp. YN15]